MVVPAEPVRFVAASDRSLLIYLGKRITLETHIEVRKLLRLLELDPIDGIRNLHPAYCSLLIQFDPLRLRHDSLETALRRYLGRLGEIHLPDARQVEIPVCYSEEFAPDLHDVAALHGLAPADVVELHSSVIYMVYFLGFVPGFAYLGGLPERLATPRLAKPRLSVPSGSVGIGGEQTGIYPFATPGGWRVIGRTPLSLFLPQRQEISSLAIGDSVRFTPISSRRFSELEAATGSDAGAGAPVMRMVEIESPGLFTTVQDLGRDGFVPLGVSPSGAADRISLRIGNRLVGNPEGAAGLEMTLVGGTFRFPQGAIVAATGSDFGATLDGAAPPPPASMWRSIEVHPGQAIQFGATRSGARCYLCVRGGIQVPEFLGSASTHVLTGLGGFHGRALRKGDALEIGPAAESFAPRRLKEEGMHLVEPRKTLRVTAGPQSDWFPESSRDFLYRTPYRVSEESNRLGLRLVGNAIAAATDKELITEGVSLGAIQIPPNGQPIVVFVDQQTTGGYPKIANVISADLDSVGQLRPRDEVRFERVDLATARSLLRAQEELLAHPGLVA